MQMYKGQTRCKVPGRLDDEAFPAKLTEDMLDLDVADDLVTKLRLDLFGILLTLGNELGQHILNGLDERGRTRKRSTCALMRFQSRTDSGLTLVEA